jgi:hypothetical protein
MSDRLFISEQINGTRTAHVFQRVKEQDYIVFCFCCGHEAESEPFPTEYDADHWAMRWLNHQEQVPELQSLNDSGGCGCQ